MIFPRLRVFVSSRMEELAVERKTVKQALEQLQVDAWVFEEDAGARPQSPQQTFLAELENADLYLGIFWTDLGPYTRAEYDYASKSGKDCLIYEKRLEIAKRRAPELEAFLNSIGNVESGRTVKRFDTADDLAGLVKQDVAAWLAQKVRERVAPKVIRQLTPVEADDCRGLEILLRKVKQFWVQGVLRNSVHQEARLEIGWESHAEAVEHPWAKVLELPDELSQISKLPVADLFEQVGRTLLILGAPGSGKTTTLLELAGSMVDRAENDDGQPIPAVFNLSSWDGRPLFSWFVGELSIRYQIPKRAGSSWLKKNRLLLLLDGLDEVPSMRRVQCVRLINKFTEDYGVPGLAVCSREDEYARLPERLRLGAAIRLQPLDSSQVSEHLARAGPSLTGLRTVLEKDEVLRVLATSPLMLDVMSLAYHDVPVKDLADLDAAPAEAKRSRVFAAYVDRMFRRRGGGEPPYPQPRMFELLSRLASGLRRHDETVFLIESLQPSWLRSNAARWFYFLTTRILSGVPVAIALSPISVYFLLLIFPLGAAGAAVGFVDYRRLRNRNVLMQGFGWKGLLRRIIATGWTAMAGILVASLIVVVAFAIGSVLSGGKDFGSLLLLPLVPFLVLTSAVIPTEQLPAWSTWLIALILWLVLIPILVGLPFSLRSALMNPGRDIRAANQLALSWRKFLCAVVLIALPLPLLQPAIGYKPGEHVLIGDSTEGSVIAVLKGHSDAESASFGPDGSRVMTTGSSGFRLWSVQTQQLLNASSQPYVPYFGADGSRYLTIEAQQTRQNACRLWDKDGKLICEFSCPMPGTWFFGDGNRLLVQRSREMHVLETSGCASLRVLAIGTEYEHQVRISPDGRHIIVWAMDDKPATLWDVDKGKILAEINIPNSLTFSPDGSYAVSCCPVKLLRTLDGAVVLEPGVGEEVVFSEDGARSVVLHSGGPQQLWDLRSSRLVARLEAEGKALFAPNGEMVVTYGIAGSYWDPGPVQLWNSEDGRSLAALGTTRESAHVSFSPDSNRIAIQRYAKPGGGNSFFEVWDTHAGRLVARLEANWLGFSPDSTRIGTTGNSGVRLWDKDGKLLASLSSWRDGTLAFSPKSDRFVAVVKPIYLSELFQAALVLGVIVGLIVGLRATPSAADPKANWGTWVLSRRALLTGVFCGLVVAIAGSLIVREPVRLLGLFVCGALLGSWLAGGQDVAQHFFLRFLLFREGQLPLSCVRFLDYGVALVILRKVGGGYIFVHRLLLDYLADRNAEKPGRRDCRFRVSHQPQANDP